MNSPVTIADRDTVAKICLRLHHAYRGLRLYPADHPAARQTMDALVEAVTSYLDDAGSMTLEVTEDQLLFDGGGVYSFEGSRDNLAFFMFRDGIRFITFRPGVEAREIEAVVDCLAHADNLADLEHDLTTALWECELHHVDYDVVDPFLNAGDGARGGPVDALRETVVRRMNELKAVTTPGLEESGSTGGGESGGGKPEEDKAKQETVDPESVALSEEDIERTEQIVSKPSDALADFAIVLLEIIGAGLETPTGDDALTGSLTMVVQQFLDTKNVDGVSMVVSFLRNLEAQGRRPAGFGAEVICQAATPEHLTGMIERMAEAPADEAARIERLLSDMRSWIYPVLLATLTEEDSDKAVRRTALVLLHLEDGVPLQYLLPLMQDHRWYVVRNAVELARGSSDPTLVGQLARLLRHPDARVRREVVRSLDMMGGPRAAALLTRSLPDEDSGVRVLAVRSLGRHGTRAQFAEVMAQVESREFEDRPPEEVEAFLLTFALLGQDLAVEKLSKLWKRRVFGNRSLPVRLAAVQALGAVTSRAAKESLQEAAKSGDAQLQRIAARALIDAQSPTAGSRT